MTDIEVVKVAEVDTVDSAHRGRSDNPHSVTAAQVGAPTQAAFDSHEARHSADGADELTAIDGGTP